MLGVSDDEARPLRFSIATWNINSVRLRIDLVAKFIRAVRPDILCLQETKCPDDAFPLKRIERRSSAERNWKKPRRLCSVRS